MISSEMGPREPIAYWLACVIGMLLGFALFAVPLILIARR